MTKGFLLIGGCMDGKQVHLDEKCESFMAMVKPAAESFCCFNKDPFVKPEKFETHRYVRVDYKEPLNDGLFDEVSILVYEDHPKGVLRTLIEGYKPS